jgi:hypothetical protein
MGVSFSSSASVIVSLSGHAVSFIDHGLSLSSLIVTLIVSCKKIPVL